MAGSSAVAQVDIVSKLSKEGRDRDSVPITLRSLVEEFSSMSGAICMHGGLPNPNLFPFKEISFTVADGKQVQINDSQKLMLAQQYGVINPKGYPPLHDWARRQVQQLHAPPLDWEVIISPGSNAAVEAVFSLLLDRGDAFLSEEYTYPQIIESTIAPRGYIAVAVAMDGVGIIPQELDKLLTGLKQDDSQPFPKLLYTVPVGQNPTGASLSLQRKRQIYDICRKFDVLILEDDAYYYIQYPQGEDDLPGVRGLVSSFLSMDVDGRVIRLDTFAKFLAPGLRLGWTTAPPKFAAKLQSWFNGTLIGSSGLSQLVTAELLLHWGESGVDSHVKELQAFYAHKARIAHEAAEKELSGLASWQRPTAGMFMWIRFNNIQDVSEVWEQLKANRVAVVPGRIAHVAPPHHFKCPFVRVAFAGTQDEELWEGMARLGHVLKTAQHTQLQTQSQTQLQTEHSINSV